MLQQGHDNMNACIILPVRSYKKEYAFLSFMDVGVLGWEHLSRKSPLPFVARTTGPETMSSDLGLLLLSQAFEPKL